MNCWQTGVANTLAKQVLIDYLLLREDHRFPRDLRKIYTGFPAFSKLTTWGRGGGKEQTDQAGVLMIQSEQCRHRTTARGALRAVSFAKIQMTFFTGLL